MVRVNISIEGLGIICFNKNKGRGEIALLRHDDHLLNVKVITRNGDLFHDYGEIPMNAEEIHFVNDTPVSRYFLNDDGRFRRRNGFENDLQDIRWILDLESSELNGEEMRPIRHPRHMLLTKMYIPDAYFYTDALTRRECDKMKLMSRPRKTHLGYVGDALGASIVAEKVTLQISGQKDLLLEEGDKISEYRVIISNLRDSDRLVSESDFPMYYEVLQDDDGDKFSVVLKPEKKDSVEADENEEKLNEQKLPTGLRGRNFICNVARWGETGSIEDLLR